MKESLLYWREKIFIGISYFDLLEEVEGSDIKNRNLSSFGYNINVIVINNNNINYIINDNIHAIENSNDHNNINEDSDYYDSLIEGKKEI